MWNRNQYPDESDRENQIAHQSLKKIGTSFVALSIVEAGYEVWANTDASGTFNANLAADANRRMEKAGVHLMGMFGIAMDLMKDWRNKPGLDEVLPFLDT